MCSLHSAYPFCRASPFFKRILHGCSQLLDLEKNYSHHFRVCAETQFLSHGKSFHARLVKALAIPSLFVANSLVNMYFKCGCMEDALRLFDEIADPDVVTWNTVITGLCLSHLIENSFGFFRKMLFCSVVPDQVSFVSLLKGCIGCGGLHKGLQLHSVLIKLGHGEDVVVGSALLKFYSNFDCFVELVKVYDGLVLKDTVLVNTMIGVLSRLGKCREAFECFWHIFSLALKPTRASFVNLFGAVDSDEFLTEGMQIHGTLIKFGLDADGAVENSLVGMYVSCNALGTAFSVLLCSESKNVMSWTSLINGYASFGFPEDAMHVFYWFYNYVRLTDSILLSCILGVSAASETLHLGAQVHSIAVKTGIDAEPCVRDSLMEMYTKCFRMEQALNIFQHTPDEQSLLSWTIVISGCVYNGFPADALKYFCFMRQQGINSDSVACTSVLMGCIDLLAISEGTQIHAYLLKSGFMSDISVQTSLLSLYADCGSLDSALVLFNAMAVRDIVSWTALMSGYLKHGYSEIALTFLLKMLEQGVKPNNFTLATSLAACTEQTATITGKLLHAYITKTGYELNKFVGSALIDMYSKCGSIEDAIQYFMVAPKSDVAIWNALLAGYAHHGNGLEVVKVFQEMRKFRVNPDEFTFLSLLSGCSHGGLATEVMQYFEMMYDDYGINPRTEHYTCVVDAFGRAGLFKNAVKFVEVMSLGHILVVLRSLLSACIVHRCLKLGFAVAAKIVLSGEVDTATYMLLSALFSADEKWDDAKKVRAAMERLCMGRKRIGHSWISEYYTRFGLG